MQYDKGQLIDEIAGALHPHWPENSRKTYLPLSLPAMVRRLVARAQADARALWSVRVLDAWTETRAKAGRWFECFPKDKGQCSCDLIGATGRESYWADSPDAARHAAALAVYPTLPADVRAKLGECP